MEIVTLDMKNYLGTCIMLYLKDGRSYYFTPLALRNGDTWSGRDQDYNFHKIHRDEIEFIRPNK